MSPEDVALKPLTPAALTITLVSPVLIILFLLVLVMPMTSSSFFTVTSISDIIFSGAFMVTSGAPDAFGVKYTSMPHEVRIFVNDFTLTDLVMILRAPTACAVDHDSIAVIETRAINEYSQ